ncbi:MAG: hypothetical protein ACI35W_05845 [Anaeroplasmataceae bacterium]
MPLTMTNYLLTTKLLNYLDETYETATRKKLNNGDMLFKSDKVFLFSNFFEVLNIENKYSIYDSFLDDKIFKNIKDITIKYIKNNHYNKENIIFIISIITARQIKIHTDLYFNYFNEKFSWDNNIQSTDADYYYTVDNSNYDFKTPLAQKFDKSFILDFDDYDFIKSIINDSLFFPLGDKLFLEQANKFQKILSHKKASFSKYKYYYYKKEKNTLTNKEFLKAKHFKNNSFYDILEDAYNDAYKEAKSLLNDVFL